MPSISNASFSSLVQSCVQRFSTLAKPDPTITPGSTLDVLAKALAKKREREVAELKAGDYLAPETKFKSKDGLAKIEIGYLHVEKDQAVIRAIAKAVREGKVSELDTGRIVGGKALNFILKLAEMAPVDKPVTIRGELRMYVITRGRENDLKSGRTGARAWTEEETRAYEESLKRMGVKNACLNLWDGVALEKCGDMHFRFESNNPDGIRWFD